MTALKSYLDEIALLATLAQENSVKYYRVALGAEEPHPYETCLNWCSAEGAGQPASLHTLTMASLVSKYTCQ